MKAGLCDPTRGPGRWTSRTAFDPDYCPRVADWDSEWARVEDEVASLVNARRSEGARCGNTSFAPAAALAMDPALRCAARHHSLDMATRGFFDHENPDGEDFADRVERAGFEWSAVGENIARGQANPSEVTADWMSSAGHCANIMNPRFEFIGVGYYGQGAYWTQTFAAE